MAKPPRATPSTPEWDALAEALTETRTPCCGSDAWTSEDPAARASAVLACRACPLTEACRAAADSTHERFGVWAGEDRSPRLGAPTRTTTVERTA